MPDDPTPIGDVIPDLETRIRTAREAQHRRHLADPERVPDPYADDGEGTTLSAAAQIEAARAAGWAELVPDAYGDPSLDDLGDDVRRHVEPWALDPQGTLLATGPVGTGKSHLGWAAIRPSWFAGRRVWAGTASALVAALRPDGSHAYRRTWDRIVGADVVLLDDLGAERVTDWSADQLGQAIHEWWERGTPVAVTTNLKPRHTRDDTPEERLALTLQDHLGERTYSRLTADTTAVRLTGEDRRRNRP